MTRSRKRMVPLSGVLEQFDSAGGAAGRRDFEDPVPGSHFEPIALYPTARPELSPFMFGRSNLRGAK